MILRQPQALWLLLILLPLFAAWLWRRRWPWPAALLRLAIVALIIVALADPVLNPAPPPERAVFLIDQSLSLGSEGRAALRRWVAEARAQGFAGAPVIAFGARPVAEVAFDPARDSATTPGAASAQATGTDLAAALDFGRQLLGGKGRLVLLSDGVPTRGDAVAAAQRLVGAGIRLDTVSSPVATVQDARMIGLAAPATLREGEQFEVTLTVDAPNAGTASLSLARDGSVVANENVSLRQGRNTFTFPERADTPGFITFRAEVNAANDGVPQNNALEGLSRVYPRPRVLIVEAEAGVSSDLRTALEASGVTAEARGPKDLPGRLSSLAAYDAVILLDVPANPTATEQVAERSINGEQMLLLQEYVRQMGRGLVVIGGRHSYALGQYKGTPLEATLPVKMDPLPRKERPPVALLLVIDHSGSMGTGPGSQLSMAKEAAILAAEKLDKGDRIGVLIFDSETTWTLPFTTVDEGLARQRIQDQIATIPSGGGTEILGALKVGLPELAKETVATKHAILLTDGRSFTGRPADYLDTVEEARRSNITLSTVAIGDGADVDLLTQLAQWGQGRYYFAAKLVDIPRISVEESAIARDDPVQEGTYRAELTAPHATLRGLPPRDLPALQGFISATPKPEAEVVLRAPEGDPLLSAWQYGLGRAVAWTSDSGSVWARDWPGWKDYGRFWAQLVRYTLADPAAGPARVDLVPGDRPGEGTLVVDALDESGNPIDLAATAVKVTPPQGEARLLRLRQTAPGRYEQAVSLPVDGAYRFEATVEKGDQRLTSSAGYVQPYPAEYAPQGDGAALLAALAQRTGGRALNAPADLRGADTPPPAPTHTLWPWLLIAALALWPIEIAVRRWARIRGAA